MKTSLPKPSLTAICLLACAVFSPELALAQDPATAAPDRIAIDRAHRVVISTGLIDIPTSTVTVTTNSGSLIVYGESVIGTRSIEAWVIATSAGPHQVVVQAGMTQTFVADLVAFDGPSTSVALEHLDPPHQGEEAPPGGNGQILVLGPQPDDSGLLLRTQAGNPYQAFAEFDAGGSVQFANLGAGNAVGGQLNPTLQAGALDSLGINSGEAYTVYVQVQDSGATQVPNVITYRVRRAGAGAARPGRLYFREDGLGHNGAAPSLAIRQGGYFDFKAARRAEAEVNVSLWLRVDATYAAAMAGSAIAPPSVTLSGATTTSVSVSLPITTPADTWTQVQLTIPTDQTPGDTTDNQSELLTLRVEAFGSALDSVVLVDNLSVTQLGGIDAFAALPTPDPTAPAQRVSAPVRTAPHALLLKGPTRQEFKSAVSGNRMLVAEAFVRVVSGTPAPQLTLEEADGSPVTMVADAQPEPSGWLRYSALGTKPTPAEGGVARVVVEISAGELALDDLRIEEAPLFNGFVRGEEGAQITWRWLEDPDDLTTGTMPWEILQSGNIPIAAPFNFRTLEHVEGVTENTVVTRFLQVQATSGPVQRGPATAIAPIKPPTAADVQAYHQGGIAEIRIREPHLPFEGLTSVEVLRSASPDMSNPFVVRAFGPLPQYTVSDAVATPSYYQVRYRNRAGVVGPPSPVIFSDPLPAPTADPTDFVVFPEKDALGVLIRAEIPALGLSGDAGLRIERATDAAFTQNVEELVVNPRTYAHRDVPGAGTFFYRIAYVDALGNVSPFSGPSTAATPGSDIPPTITAAPGAVLESSTETTETIRWTWNIPMGMPPGVSYRVFDADTLELLAQSTSTSYTETLNRNATVERKVMAFKGLADAGLSPAGTYTAGHAEFAVGATPLEAHYVSEDKVRVTVERPPYDGGTTRVKVERSLSGDFSDTVLVSNVVDRYVVFDDLPPNTQILPSYRVTYRTASGQETAPSGLVKPQTLSVHPVAVWAVEELGQENQTILVNSSSQPYKIQLIDLEGAPLAQDQVSVTWEVRTTGDPTVAAEFRDGEALFYTWRTESQTDADGIAVSPRLDAAGKAGFLSVRAICDLDGRITTLDANLRIVTARLTLTASTDLIEGHGGGPPLSSGFTVTARDESGAAVSGVELVFSIEDPAAGAFAANAPTATLTTDGSGQVVLPDLFLGTACERSHINVAATIATLLEYEVFPTSVALRVDTHDTSPQEIVRLDDRDLIFPAGAAAGPLRYQVRDGCGNPVPNVPVRIYNLSTSSRAGGTPRTASFPPNAVVPQRTDQFTDPISVSFGSVPQPRVFHTTTLVAPGKALVAGGALTHGSAAGQTALERLAPNGLLIDFNACTTDSAVGITPRLGHTATLLPNGNVLIVGGRDGANIVPTQIYQTSAGTVFNPVNPNDFPAIPRYDHSAIVVGSVVVLVGGRDAAGNPVTKAELLGFDGSKQNWPGTSSSELDLDSLERIAPGLTRFQKEGSAHDQKVLVVGSEGATVPNFALAIDVANASFTALPQLPVPTTSPAGGIVPNRVVSLARNASEPDQGLVLVMGQFGSLVYDPEVGQNSLVEYTKDNSDPGVVTFNSLDGEVVRIRSARPGSTLDRILITNHEGKAIFWSREDLGHGTRFFKTANMDNPIPATGYTATALTRNAGYERTIGEVIYLGGVPNLAASDNNDAFTHFVPFSAPAARVSGSGGSGGGPDAPLSLLSDGAGVVTVRVAVLEPTTGRHTIRIETVPLGTGRSVSTFSNLFVQDPLKKAPVGGDTPAGSGSGGGVPPGEPEDRDEPPFGSHVTSPCLCKGDDGSEIAIEIPEGVKAAKIEVMIVDPTTLGSQGTPATWLETVSQQGFTPPSPEANGLNVGPAAFEARIVGGAGEGFVIAERAIPPLVPGGPTFAVGERIALSRFSRGFSVDHGGNCIGSHYHAYRSPAPPVLIDGLEYPDPDENGCGFGKIVTLGRGGESTALEPEVSSSSENGTITITNPSASDPLKTGTVRFGVGSSEVGVIGLVTKTTDFEGNVEVCARTQSVGCVDIQINSGLPLLINADRVRSAVAAAPSISEYAAGDPPCYSWVTGTYTHSGPTALLYQDGVPNGQQWGDSDPCCVVCLETTKHFVFDNGQRVKILLNSCKTSPFEIKEKLIPVGPTGSTAKVRAYLLPLRATLAQISGFVIGGLTNKTPPPPKMPPLPKGKKCAEATTCVVAGTVWICNKGNPADNVLVTSFQEDTIGVPDPGNIACPSKERKLCKDPNYLFVEIEGDGDGGCVIPLDLEIANLGGEASFSPCVADLRRKVLGVPGQVIKVELWGLKESCNVGDVKISASVGSSAQISPAGGSMGISGTRLCLPKQCAPTVTATVVGVRSTICNTDEACDDLVPMTPDGNPSTIMKVVLIGPVGLGLDVCLEQEGAGAVNFSETPPTPGNSGTPSLVLAGLQAIAPVHCGVKANKDEAIGNSITREPAASPAGNTRPKDPAGDPPCPGPATAVYLTGVTASANAFDTNVLMRVKISDTKCPAGSLTEVPPPELSTIPRKPDPKTIGPSIAPTPPSAKPGETLLSRCEDLTVAFVELVICGTGDDDDLGCVGGGIPVTVNVVPPIPTCDAAKPFRLTYLGGLGKLDGGSATSVNLAAGETIPISDFSGPSLTADDQQVILERTCGGNLQQLAEDAFTVIQGRLTLPRCVCADSETAAYSFMMLPQTGWNGRTFKWVLRVDSGNIRFGGSETHMITVDPTQPITEAILEGGGSGDKIVDGSVIVARTKICGVLENCGSAKTTVVGLSVASSLPGQCLSQKFAPTGKVVFKLEPGRVPGCEFEVSLFEPPGGTPVGSAIRITPNDLGDRIEVTLEAIADVPGKHAVQLVCSSKSFPDCKLSEPILFGNDYGNKPARDCPPGDPAALAAGLAKGAAKGFLNDSVDPVDLARGELTLTRADLSIPGRGFDFTHVRTYRSMSTRDTGQGFGWDFNFNTRLPELNPGSGSGTRALVEGGTNIESVFSSVDGSFRTPPTIFGELTELPDGTFRILDRDGSAKFFDVAGRLIRMEDVHKNTMEFFYGVAGDPAEARDVLTKVRDTLGRDILYKYYPASIQGLPRLHQLVDFTGRTVTYSYDAEGNLTSVQSPQVTTPGNAFPTGKRESYSYSSGSTVAELNHNLETITAPNQNVTGSERGATDGTPLNMAVTRVTYDLQDRVKTEFWGSGEVTYTYMTDPVADVLAANPMLHDEVVRKTHVEDRNGNETIYWINPGNVITAVHEIITPTKTFSTYKVHDRNNQCVRTTYPRGNVAIRVFDDGVVDLPDGSSVIDPRLQANALVTLVTPAMGVDQEGGYAIVNGDQQLLITAAIWDNIYGQPCIQFEPRAFALPAEQGPLLPTPGTFQTTRFSSRIFFDYEEGVRADQVGRLAAKLGTTADYVQALFDRNEGHVVEQIQNAILNLAGRNVEVVAPGLPSGVTTTDFNEDGVTDQVNGDHVLTKAPVVHLTPDQVPLIGTPGSTVQEGYSTQTYNRFGQTTSATDEEGNTTRIDYHPASNPSGQAGITSGQISPEVLRANPDTETGGYTSEVVVDTTLPLLPAVPGEPAPTPMLAARRSPSAPPPLELTSSYTYNLRGAGLTATDPRGAISRVELNELDQTVTSFSRGPYFFETRYVYDANDNVIEVHVEDRRAKVAPNGGPIHDAQANVVMDARIGFFVHKTSYNILDNVIKSEEDARDRADDTTPKVLTTTYELDPNQNLELTTLPRGNQIRREYDARDLAFRITTGLGLPATNTQFSVRVYEFDANKGVHRVTDAEPTGAGMTGDVVRIEYDGFGRPRRTIDALGNEAVTRRDPMGNQVGHVAIGPVKQGAGPNVELSRVDNYFDERARGFQADQHLYFPNGVSSPVPLGTEGDLTPSDGKLSRRFSYDRANRRVAVRDDDLDTSLWSYDGANRMVRFDDAAGNRVTYQYDANSNQIGSVETDVDSNRATPVANEQITDHYVYDTLDRRTRAVDTLGNEAKQAFDSRSNRTLVLDSLGNVTRLNFDGLNRVRTTVRDLRQGGRGLTAQLDQSNVHNPDGQIRSESIWDDNGNLQTLIDDGGNRTTYRFDAHDRSTRVSYATGAVETVTYDRDHNALTRTDANANTFTVTYDAINRPTLVEITPKQGVRADDSPDDDPAHGTNSRIVNVIGTSEQGYAYDGLSRLVEVSDNNDPGRAEDDSLCTMTYDSLSRVVAEAQSIGGISRTTGYEWEFFNEQTTVVYGNGRRVKRAYDQLDRITDISDDNSSGPAIDRFRYMGMGRILEARHGNGTRLSYLNDTATQQVGYDRLRRPIQRRDLRSDGSLVVGFAHGFDTEGNRVFEQKLHDTAQSERWQLDSAYRMTNFERGSLGTYTLGQQAVTETLDRRPAISNVTRSRTWALDGLGSWKAGTETTTGSGGPTSVSFTRGTSPRHEYTSESRTVTPPGGSPTTTPTSYLCDPNGNLVSDGRFIYSWDALNRLVEIRNAGPGEPLVARYSYDAMGRRTRKEVTDQGSDAALEGVTLFFYDTGQILEELFQRPGPGETPVLERQFVYGLTLDAPCTIDRYRAGPGSDPLPAPGSNALTTVETGSGPVEVHRLYYARNALGSVFALTNTVAATPGDPGAHLVEAYEYDPYGRQTTIRPPGASANVTFGPTDTRALGGRSGFDNPYTFTGRYLDAETGLLNYRNRYYDVVLGRFLSADPTGYADGLNQYQYAGGNPLNLVDPTGTEAIGAVGGAVGGALMGGIMSALTGGDMYDIMAETFIGGVEGAIVGALCPSAFGLPIGAAVAGALRGAYKYIRRMIECGLEFDAEAFLKMVAKEAVINLVTTLVSAGLMKGGGAGVRKLLSKFGADDALKKINPCVASAGVAAASIGAGAAASNLANCFLAGTEVETEDGTKKIEDVEVGDRVLSRDEKTGEQGYKKVKQLFRNTTQKVVTVQVARVDAETVSRVRTGAQGRTERRSRSSAGSSKAGSDEGGDGLAEPPLSGAVEEGGEGWTIECTPGHPWWVRGTGWVYAGALEAGDLLRGSRGEVLEVVSVRVESREARTFNFEVAGWHTYFAGEVWVHNCSPGKWEYSGGKTTSQKATYTVDSSGRITRAEAIVNKRHPGRDKESIKSIIPDGRQKGDHRGHLIPENYVNDPSVVNVPENIIAEAAKSNLGSKKSKVENPLGRLFDDGHRDLRMVSEPRYRTGAMRPYEVRHRVYGADGTLHIDATVKNPSR